MTDGPSPPEPAAGPPTERTTPPPPPPRPPRRRINWHIPLYQLGLMLRVFILLPVFLLAVAYATLFLTGKTLPLPVWAVSEIERRLNLSIADSIALSISVDHIGFAIGRDGVPRLSLADLRLARSTGATLLRLPEARVTLAPDALLGGALRPRALTLIGATVTLRRDRAGRFDLDLGDGAAAQVESFAALIDLMDQAFQQPALANLRQIDAEAMTLILTDARSGQTWNVGDGRLALENRETEVAAELGMTLVSRGTASARAVLILVSRKGSAAARLTASVDKVAAADIALQSAPLGFLSILDAPISGELVAVINDAGTFSSLEGRLAIGKGAIRPTPDTKPVAFDHAGLNLAYDSATESLTLTNVRVEGPSVRLSASAQVLLPGVRAGLPEAFITQVNFNEVMVDPEGLFVEPVRFTDGALDLRLRLNPFVIDIGQLALIEDSRRLSAKGRLAAADKGWDVALDIGLNEITHQKLLALWPVGLVPRTRAWLVENVQESRLFDVKAALRLNPKKSPRLSLSYEFAGADARFIKTLPLILDGAGYATIEGQTFTMVLDRGRVTPPLGGDVNVAGTIFTVLDISQRPAQAEIRLRTDSTLTAALSLLDEEPFRFLTKAGRPVTLGEGRITSTGLLRLPLVRKIDIKDIRYEITGTLRDLTSDVVVPDHRITATALAVTADPAGLVISGPGQIGALPFNVTYAQSFAPEARGKSLIEGTVELSPAAVAEFRLGLPDGMITGQGTGSITVAMTRGAAPRLSLTSNLQGLGLSLPELSYAKPKDRSGSLTLSARLSSPPVVDSVALEAPGLSLAGSITLRDSGTLDAARFDRLRVGDWFDAKVTLTGKGTGRAPAIALTGGTIDMRKMSFGSRKGGAGLSAEMPVSLDRLTVTDSIALTAFNGTFRRDGGLSGQFTARVNGKAEVAGGVAQVKGGTGVRIRSADAGGVLAAAGIFSNASGGNLDMQLLPAGPEGRYNGIATATAFRVRGTPVLAELLNAISVIGLLEQMNGGGIVFQNADARFVLTPEAIEVTSAAAVGASMGISMAGLYVTETGSLNMQGVISPIYLVNAIGQLFSKPGEGLFGFNYQLTGTADRPVVSVNPLSIITPGLFREIFRQPPPKLPAPETLAPETLAPGG